ncbi:MAG: GNAT family N-acetyltransferase [Opitutae bacterium]|nr:GNAT family N-acetyltransferase [Opitutae bacterium]
MNPLLPPAFTLRQWRDDDLDAFAEMNADPELMRHMPAALTREESAATLARVRDGIAARGWGLWAVEVDGELAGWTGLNPPAWTAHFTPCVEVGWRLRRKFWGRGLATAAAREAVRYGFETLQLGEIVSFTVLANERSWRVMERLGFTRDLAGDFDHPRLPEGHPLRRHILYRKKNPARRE